ncbi:uncharacterized protein B0T23DRAFT_103365 [Neurospora hispaniola]|uniref:Uncharacterized protein n=1 Tax=Neurospora hispaniola TaxID=588809 RepID=A0AAJ0MRZ8_9PEZI|nr:hypothetical protein B0T23DRAFT_103365 [Neurospora hispaniola]
MFRMFSTLICGAVALPRWMDHQNGLHQRDSPLVFLFSRESRQILSQSVRQTIVQSMYMASKTDRLDIGYDTVPRVCHTPHYVHYSTYFSCGALSGSARQPITGPRGERCGWLGGPQCASGLWDWHRMERR